MPAVPSSSDNMPPPERRPLRIFASDPMRPADTATIEVKNESLTRGPVGSRLEVIDYDGAHKVFYRPVNLDDPTILIQDGLQPSESDPCFHQQMVYAVSMRVLETFDHALGRRLSFGRQKGGRLRIFPHAFHGPNAFFDPGLGAVLFGYFKASEEEPGRNLPGQMVHTCLSHDIIAHEVTHSLVHRLRPLLNEPTNRDVLAFHEGFADIVALFQHFSYADLLRPYIQAERTNLRDAKLLVGLAQQFGEATGSGAALRSAIEPSGTPRRLDDSIWECHERGSILVAAVFDAFFNVYQERIRDLVRIATGGTGNLPDADLHPDLVSRVAREAAKSARTILTMCVRAFDYLPPVDVTFGDYLRALVTADLEVVSQDRLDQRTLVIEAFRRRGIFPENVASLAQESLFWPISNRASRMPDEVMRLVAIHTMRGNGDGATRAVLEGDDPETPTAMRGLKRSLARALHGYARTNARALELDPDRTIRVHGFHPAFRIAPDGSLVIELVAQFTQQDKSRTEELGGIPLRGGTTVIAAPDGTVRYVISKPIPRKSGSRPGAQERLERQLAYLKDSDARDAFSAWSDARSWRRRVKRRMDFRAICGGMSQ